MPDVTVRFRAADTLPARDLWSDIVAREPGSPPPAPAGRRVAAAIVALAVVIAGLAIAVRAFHRPHPVVPAGAVANGKILVYNLYASAAHQIWVMNPDGSGMRELRKLPANASLPAWSPDGKRIAFAIANSSSRPMEIWIAQADGSGAHVVFACADHFSTAKCHQVFDGLAWSPGGRQIAFLLGSLYVMNEDGTSLHRLYRLNLRTVSSPPAWSPDGRWILFPRTTGGAPGAGGAGNLYLAAADGSGIRQLTHCGPIGHATCAAVLPTWAPDGRSIAFADETTGAIRTIGVDGSNLRTLVTPPRGMWYRNPIWSPDGNDIVYEEFPMLGSKLPPIVTVYEMRADGSNPITLHVSGQPILLSWQRLPSQS